MIASMATMAVASDTYNADQLDNDARVAAVSEYDIANGGDIDIPDAELDYILDEAIISTDNLETEIQIVQSTMVVFFNDFSLSVDLDGQFVTVNTDDSAMSISADSVELDGRSSVFDMDVQPTVFGAEDHSMTISREDETTDSSDLISETLAVNELLVNDNGTLESVDIDLAGRSASIDFNGQNIIIDVDGYPALTIDTESGTFVGSGIGARATVGAHAVRGNWALDLMRQPENMYLHIDLFPQWALRFHPAAAYRSTLHL